MYVRSIAILLCSTVIISAAPAASPASVVAAASVGEDTSFTSAAFVGDNTSAASAGSAGETVSADEMALTSSVGNTDETAVATETMLSPASYLGFEPGERFSRHHEISAYFRYVAENSPHVEWRDYGESYLGRPLFAVIVSSEENIRGLDSIWVNNRRMAGLKSGDVEGRTAAIAWLSYGIHGNESSSPEAAMQTLFALAKGAANAGDNENGDDDIAGWLEETVVIIDPVLNPDGRERYVSWFEQTQGRRPDPRLETREHNEPWPGSRSNHYYFDLNRDWAWQTQQESSQRAAFYHLWMPHVHADFHEMFTNDYYFPPAAEPYHSTITPWQREFQEKIGQNHAQRFDERSERYFTGEIFDLFYPGFGDTWPTFNGAIGMTYEQMGHSRAGTKMIDEHGDTLTLSDRIRNHHEAGLSTVEVTAQNSERLIREFHEYFRASEDEPDGRYASFVISGENNRDRLTALLGYLDRQEIRYFPAEPDRRMQGRHYLSGEQQQRRTMEGDIVIPMQQPKSVLAHVLFDPDPSEVLADSNTYDITAWALPYAYGLEAWAVEDRVRISRDYSGGSAGGTTPEGSSDDAVRSEHASGYIPLESDTAYAWVLEWGDVRDAAFAADLLQRDVRMRVTESSFTVDGRVYPPGSMVITRRSNRHMEDRISGILDDMSAKHNRRVSELHTGRTESGVDLGSPRIHPMKKPIAAVPAGRDINAGQLGEIRHYFDYILDYPLAVFDSHRLASFPLNDYNLLILPDGSYERWDEADRERVMSWVRDGGRLIAYSDAAQIFSEKEDSRISVRDTDPEDRPEVAGHKDDQPEGRRRFEDRRRNALSRQISGAVYRVELDESHPLAYGLGESYATLKRGLTVPELLENGWNVGVLPENDALLGGWAGSQTGAVVNGSLMAGTISKGEGQLVILADNPLFRGFWRNGQLLFSNAVFQAWIAR